MSEQASSNAIDAYEDETARTDAPPGTDQPKLLILALDLCGEAGDVLWYLTRLGAVHSIRLREVASTNVEKLRKRYPNGFIEGGGNR